jgi:DnaJ-class molecular chaperone
MTGERVMTDYYAVLGVQSEDSTDFIKKRFKALAQKYHPDLNPNNLEEAEIRFKEINEAWQILGNEEKRKKYDEQRRLNIEKSNTSAGKGSVPVSGVNFSDLMGQFDSFFGKAVQANSAPKAEKNPLDAGELFEKFMGFGKFENK